MSVVKAVRVYSDDSGESHMDHRAVAIKSAAFAPPAPPMGVSEMEPAEGWRFLHLPPLWVGDWHPTPIRMWIFCLAGEMEFHASDGATHRLKPGDAMLLEDITGKGHRSHVVGEIEAHLVTVQLQGPRIRAAALHRPSPEA
jgi:quercetin dioxygenase-like cupin family protein